MENLSDQPWVNTLTRCGLQFVGYPGPRNVQSVNAAIYAVTGIDVEPTAVVHFSSPHAADELDRKWHHCATESSLYGEGGKFFILPPVSGGAEIGWVEVVDPIGEKLPSRIAAVTGSREFLAISNDYRRLCAISVEDDEFWVVQRNF